MSDKDPRGKGTILRALGYLFLLLVAYVLSIGPVKKLELAGYLPSKLVEIAYRPLRIVNGTPLESVLIWYLQWWFPPKYIGDLPLLDVRSMDR
jgi:hypothetical protein